MTPAPRISVVIPTIAQREHLLDRAVASVTAQTRPATHVIVVRDHDREGAAATRNRGLAQVDTELVAFIDDDDEWYPDHLRLLARAMRLSGADVVYPGYDTTGDDPVNCFGIPFDIGLLRRANYIPVTVLARVDKVLDAGGFQPHPDANGDPCEDWGLWLAMAERGCRFEHLPRRTWRWHNDGPTTRGRGVEDMPEVEQAASGLWVAHGFNFLRHRATRKTVTLRSGERALVTVDDSGTVTQIETAERMDAIVRPRSVRIRIPIKSLGA